ncbi:tagatose-6-phosphate kinase [Ligilactobacillus salitolerans]|uniref:Tagatose-6-phosphate kinase n=1 Tax=Ligilactobacillus salitolerans TaxID=1808352 RepID=A0A401IQ97_9LACO|nr:hexose kinase [Ligilactobacillus salitolerans]GBG93696.1 tagatose-6-phosphate kinase [Ligilactobacillus salitolerans]
MPNKILAITMNPSVDISYPIDHLQLDTVNRVSNVTKTAGGKGLNVARVVYQLQEPVSTSGVLGGTIGTFISQQLADIGLQEQFLHIPQESRNCIAILHDDGQQTEVLEAGPTLTADQQVEFMDHFDQLLNEVSLVTISGSLPRGFAVDLYADMVEAAAKKDVKVILDSSGASLAAGISKEHKPLLIKPNQEEIAQLVGRKLNDLADLQHVLLNEEVFGGLEWVVVSLGKDGALAKVGQELYRVTIPKINVVNPVGSGDSTVAGLAVGINRHESVPDVLKTAMTTGMLNTMEKETGHIDPTLFDEYFAKVSVEKIN